MPGDPLRAKFIAQTYLKDYKLVNSVRNMLAYTGFYKGKKITVFSSGMGMASMGIYCYELYKFFDVKYIIRIGSCGSTDKDVKLLDTILSTSSYTETNFSYTYSSVNVNEVNSSEYLNNIIINKNKNIKRGKTVCSMVFDAYIDNQDEYNKRLPQDVLAVEMEAFALFYIAKLLMPFITDTMLNDFIAIGGLLTFVLGLSIAQIKQISAVNLLPSLLLIWPSSYLFSLLMG